MPDGIRARQSSSKLVRGCCHTPAVGSPSRHFPRSEPHRESDAREKMEGSIVERMERPERPERDDKALDLTLGQIEKQFGKGAIMRLGEHGNVGVAAIPTGALALDIALGIGGLP